VNTGPAPSKGPTTTEADRSLRCMSALVDGLVAAGVRDASVSPGSRSTSLALAFARHPAVRVHVHLDERSSGFFALGLAKASGDPVAVVTTSGTAAANVFPAVIEASMARVALVVLTADRPPELRGVGANQTIDQVELYGRHVRAFVDTPVPGDAPSATDWRQRGIDAARASVAHPPGPVHLNLPFREPLVPGPDEADGGWEAPAPGGYVPAAVREGPGSSDERSVSEVVEDLAGAARGLVYAGGLRSGGEEVVALADRLGWPLIAEPHSGARRGSTLSAGALLLGSDAYTHRRIPEVVLQVGAAPTSRAGLALIGRTPRVLIVDPDDVVADPLRRAAKRIVAEPARVLRSIPNRSVLSDGDRARTWTAEWRAASDRARAVVDAMLDAWEEPFEGRVARDVVDLVPDGSVLCLGSSLPIRDADAFMRPCERVRILANRGASGIDGFVSTTLGAAASGAPTTALMGDLTLLHDVGALVWSARRGYDAVIVVLANGGGRIFSLLEHRSIPELEPLFTTPHETDLGAIVRAAGAAHTRVDQASDVATAIRDAHGAGGLHVVEVVIDAERDRVRREELRVAVDEAVR
jgi:2-succinyl-5-enolpyruvyl-6-hydroxy-3-cyclohexene-1-carboxylate synthase